MKAMIFQKYGPPEVLEMAVLPKPIPKENEVLIKVCAASAMPGDCEIRRFDIHILFWIFVRALMGIFRPKQKRQILGMELSGEIVAVGTGVTKFKVDDEVIASTELNFGAYAQYTCLPDSATIIAKPKNVSHEEAATLPVSGINALHYMRQGDIQPGDKVLIIGAAGCFGTYAVQLAKMWGAEVTGVDSTDKISILTSLGADHTIDYTQADFRKSSRQYDVIFDVIGKNVGLNMKSSLAPHGKYILATPWVGATLQGLWRKWTSKQSFVFNLAKDNIEDFTQVRDWLESGQLKPVVDRVFQLEELVEAHRYVEQKLKKGHVAITIPHNS